MTGELTVVGEVLPIGGVREKVPAAKNFGLKRVVLPKGNEPDVLELKQDLVAGLEIVYAERFEEVYDLCFGAPEVGAGKRRAAAKATGRKRSAKPARKGKSRRAR